MPKTALGTFILICLRYWYFTEGLINSLRHLTHSRVKVFENKSQLESVCISAMLHSHNVEEIVKIWRSDILKYLSTQLVRCSFQRNTVTELHLRVLQRAIKQMHALLFRTCANVIQLRHTPTCTLNVNNSDGGARSEWRTELIASGLWHRDYVTPSVCDNFNAIGSNQVKKRLTPSVSMFCLVSPVKQLMLKENNDFETM